MQKLSARFWYLGKCESIVLSMKDEKKGEEKDAAMLVCSLICV